MIQLIKFDNISKQCTTVPDSFVGISGKIAILRDTVNSEIFARVLFTRNFAYAKFRENKILAKWRNHSVDY